MSNVIGFGESNAFAVKCIYIYVLSGNWGQAPHAAGGRRTGLSADERARHEKHSNKKRAILWGNPGGLCHCNGTPVLSRISGVSGADALLERGFE